MGMNVLEECRRLEVRKLVLVGTVCAYPKLTPVPFSETDLWSGYPDESNAPYGIAKRTLLTGAWAYREQYGLNVIYVIPANLYGPRDNFDTATSHVIPAIIRKTVDARQSGTSRVLLWGDGSPTREFLYVEDCAEALVGAASEYEGAEPVNLGTGEEISIRDLALLIADVTGFEGKFVWDPEQPGGQPRRRLDVDRAAERLDFRARTPLREGLERTVAWYLAHRSSPLVAG